MNINILDIPYAFIEVYKESCDDENEKTNS